MNTQSPQHSPLAVREQRLRAQTFGTDAPGSGLATRVAATVLLLALQACAGMHEERPTAPQRAGMATRHAMGAFAAPTPKTLARETASEPTPVPGVGQEAAERAAAGATSTTAHAKPPEAMGEEVVSIAFESGSATPTAGAASALEAIAQRGKLAPLIVVDGYARRGGADNLALAHQRALAVKSALVARGLDEKRIRTNAATTENTDPSSTRVDVRLVARISPPGM